MKILQGILFIIFFIIPLYSQTAENWKNYTNMQDVNAVAAAGNSLWAATSGGGFLYDNSSGTYKTLHKADGLNGQDLTAVTIDKYGKIWFGSAEGIIDVYNPADNSVKSILDIYNSDKDSKQINQLVTSGDTIIVSTAFGISLIDSKNLVFYDTFFKLGSLLSNSVVNSTLKNNLMYACTPYGLAIQKAGATNLSAPESWNVYTSNDGLPSDNVNKAVFYQGNLIIATSNGLAELNNTTWQTFVPQLLGSNVSDMLIVGDTLFIASGGNIDTYVNGNFIQKYTLNSVSTQLAYSSSLGLLAATAAGVVQVYKSAVQYLVPNGPETNLFPSMAVDNNGVLWCASGTDASGKGFYSYDGSKWTNYNIENDSTLVTNFYYSVYAAPSNTVYFGNWGDNRNAGSCFIRIRNNKIANFNRQNTGMVGIPINPNFVVITGFAVDSRNNLWVLNYGDVNEKPLNMLSTDSLWYHYTMPAAPHQYVDQYFNLAIDQFDTKWFSTYNENKPGLYYFNENKTYDNLNDDEYGYFSTSDGLTSNTVNSIVVDQRGDVWVGTSLGANIISNTESILSSGGPQFSISSVFSLRQQSINCIAVDPINQKWVGTDQGLLLVNSDGSSLLAAYNTQNSPLLSDQITSITINPNTGTVYVGTNQGLTSFQTSAIKPQESFTSLLMYPSPFVLTNGINKLTIDGLIRDSEIKILSVTGRLVKKFSSPGGRVAYWDGTDENGNLVNSGIYFVVAYDSNGNNVFTGKIAVLKK